MEPEREKRSKQNSQPTAMPHVSAENTEGQELLLGSRIQTVQRWQNTIGNRRTTQRIKTIQRLHTIQRDDDNNAPSGSGTGGGQATLPEPGNFQLPAGQLQSIYNFNIPSNVAIQGAAPAGTPVQPEAGNVVQADDDPNPNATRDPYTIQITATIPHTSLYEWRNRSGTNTLSLLTQPSLQLSVNLDPTAGPMVPQSYAAYIAVTALNWHIQRNWLDLTVSLGQLGIGPDTGTGVSGQVGGQASLALPGNTNLVFSGAVTVAPNSSGGVGVTPNPFTITFGGSF